MKEIENDLKFAWANFEIQPVVFCIKNQEESVCGQELLTEYGYYKCYIQHMVVRITSMYCRWDKEKETRYVKLKLNVLSIYTLNQS